MIAVDTNLLIYAFRRGTAEHRAARRALERAMSSSEGWGFSFPCLAEFWSVVTHAASPGGPADPRQATAFVTSLGKEGGAQIWTPGPGFALRLLQLAAAQKVSGGFIFDLQIALLAFENGASEIWTHDRGFYPLPGLRVVDPLSS